LGVHGRSKDECSTEPLVARLPQSALRVKTLLC
jgi:hypothetical protein